MQNNKRYFILTMAQYKYSFYFHRPYASICQYIIGRLIETGQYDRHIRRLNNAFRKRLELFLTEFSNVKEKIKKLSNGSGQYCLLEFSAKTNLDELIEKALLSKLN